MSRSSLIVFLVLLAVVSVPVVAQDAVARDLQIDLGAGFTAQAQYTYPAQGEAPFPTLVLFHGSGPYDLDATVMVEVGGEAVSTNFRLMAEELAALGVAVLRFNKRGVMGGGEYDFEQIQTSTLDRLVADADAVIAAALAQPETDPARLYLYGWSEGAWVATNAAKNHPDDVAGVVLQGAPNGDLSTVLPYQHLEIGLPYLADEIDADGDGALALEEIVTLPAGYAVSLMANFYLLQPSATPTPVQPQINTFTDANGDGLIDIEGELRPTIEQFIANLPSFVPQGEASYQTAEVLAEFGIPALLVHGELDGWVPLRSAEAIAAVAPETVTLMAYPGLGHALSPVESALFDRFGVMDAQVIADIAAWVVGQD